MINETWYNGRLVEQLDQSTNTFTRWAEDGTVIERWDLQGRTFEVFHDAPPPEPPTVTYLDGVDENGVPTGEPVITPAPEVDYIAHEIYTDTTRTSFNQNGTNIIVVNGTFCQYGTCLYTNLDGTSAGGRELTELEAVSLIDWSGFTKEPRTIEQKLADLREALRAAPEVSTIDELAAAIALALDD